MILQGRSQILLPTHCIYRLYGPIGHLLISWKYVTVNEAGNVNIVDNEN